MNCAFTSLDGLLFNCPSWIFYMLYYNSRALLRLNNSSRIPCTKPRFFPSKFRKISLFMKVLKIGLFGRLLTEKLWLWFLKMFHQRVFSDWTWRISKFPFWRQILDIYRQPLLNGHLTRFSVAHCSGFIYIYIFFFFFFDEQFRLFSFSDSNTYLDTEISIISLRYEGLEITLVWFSPLFARFSLCLHFTFLSLTVARGVLFKILSPLFHVV